MKTHSPSHAAAVDRTPLRQRLVLGTAQLTQSYGVFGSASRRDEARTVLQAARKHGINAIDTAAEYGEAEQAIGEALRQQGGIEVITKSAHLPVDAAAEEKTVRIQRSAAASLQRLGFGRISVLLLHNVGAFDAPVAAALDDLKSKGTVQRVGVSVYSAEEIDRVCAMWRPDVVQLPLNLFDQRLLASGHLSMLRRRGVEVHVRSAFLQGVLLAQPAALPERLAGLREPLSRLDQAVGSRPQERAAACLGFLAALADVDRIVIGAQNAAQLDELVAAADAARSPAEPEQFAIHDPRLVDPRLWPQ